MKNYHLVPGNHPALRARAAPVTKIDAALRDQIRAMRKLMRYNGGCGIAANQVGETNRIFLLRSLFCRATCINPEIAWASRIKQPFAEGCLSLPGQDVFLWRPAFVLLRYTTLKGRRRLRFLWGLAAVIAQHEMDHLNGILITDRRRERRAGLALAA